MSIRIQLFLLGAAVLLYLAARWWYLVKKSSTAATQELPAHDASERIDPLSAALEALPSGGFDPAAFPDLPSAQPTIAERRGTLHPTIDCMAQIEIDAPLSGEFALGALPTTRRVGSKTWLIEGLNTETEHWEKIYPSAGKTYHYSAFQAGIQLVNRNGALNEVEFSEFVVKASQVAEGLGGTAQFPEMLAEVAKARELEQFTMGHDIRLTLHLHAKRAAWSLPYVQQHAQRAGFVAGVIPGRWVLGMPAGGARVDMLALTVDAQAAMADDVSSVPIRKLSLTLEVPQTARGDAATGRPFEVMSDLAIRLCASMEAAILDEQGLVVDAAALQRTSEELETVYDRLDAAGLPAGSPLAKRLFS
jgi:hypothetical protein